MDYLAEAKKLCSKLTLEEKIGQITYQVCGFHAYEKVDGKIEFTKELEDVVKSTGVGAISALFRGDPWTKKGYGAGIEIEERAEAVKAFQDYVMKNSKHKIPVFIDIEAAHGMQSLGSVMYPVGLCSAASFNPELYGKMMKRIGEEIKASGNHIALVTLIDLARDPRWGRSEECLGEDPNLTSCFIKEAVENMKEAGTMICAKHFFGAGDAIGGGNAHPITTSEREIREILLPPAKAAVEAGCDVIMVAYNAMNGEPIHFSKHYLTDVLRDELGYEGIILSDGNGIYSAATQVEISNEKAAIKALEAGIDMSLQDDGCFSTLIETAKNDEKLQEYIDRACERVLAKKMEMGLFENPYGKPENMKDFIPNTKGEKLAYDMAAESITLVKNDNNLLPLKKDTKICVLGENAANIYYLLGDYTSDRKEGEGASIKDAISEVFPNAVYEKGWNFTDDNYDEKCLEAVENCDVVVLCMGGSSVRHSNVEFLANGALVASESYIDCGEGGDLSQISLTKGQEKLLDAVKKIGKPVVSLFVIGRAYAISDLIDKSDASLICWYPGQEGGRAVADILAGNVNPSGRMPVSIPKNAGCIPACYNSYVPYRNYRDTEFGENKYSFGYGLSYTNFEYSNVDIVIEDNKLVVKGNVANTGDFDGKETIILYVHKRGGSFRHRMWEMLRFDKVELKQLENCDFGFEVELDELRDVINGELPEELLVRVGNTMQEIKLFNS